MRENSDRSVCACRADITQVCDRFRELDLERNLPQPGFDRWNKQNDNSDKDQDELGRERQQERFSLASFHSFACSPPTNHPHADY